MYIKNNPPKIILTSNNEIHSFGVFQSAFTSITCFDNDNKQVRPEG